VASRITVIAMCNSIHSAARLRDWEESVMFDRGAPDDEPDTMIEPQPVDDSPATEEVLCDA
jgi:hypothetical protein